MCPDSVRKKILVVSDESDTRIFLSNLLCAEKIEPIGAESSQEGIDLAGIRAPDLIIVNVMMADREGIKLYRKLKNDDRFRHIPVIMLSAIDRETFFLYEKFKSTRDGPGVPEPDGYLEKPPEADDLIRLVHLLIKPDGGKGSGLYR